MSYQLYRNTALGNSLQESLDELMQSQQFTQLALQVLLQFEKRIRIRVYFRGSLNTYRFCLMPCMVVHARHPSTLGGKGGRIT
uniref:Transcription initiation factor IIA gamma chain n=1 Tax=Aotus nancymaae TaxID=37293 RepID=A0A2K5CDZ3_AOTNA